MQRAIQNYLIKIKPKLSSKRDGKKLSFFYFSLTNNDSIFFFTYNPGTICIGKDEKPV